ncbi:MAG TPA: hypothetical protein PK006_12695 [Saprospiraceae bacterium]|nr:hypothetical protein [Saprospiraceae bacterium]
MDKKACRKRQSRACPCTSFGSPLAWVRFAPSRLRFTTARPSHSSGSGEGNNGWRIYSIFVV